MSDTNKVITGKITKILPVEEISGGKYRKQVFAVTNNDGYEGAEAIYAFEIFEAADKDKIEKFKKFNKVGSVVDVSYEIRCNEYNDKFFTSLSAWKVFKADTDTEPTEGTDDDEEAPF
jgi:hypothetical protein